jgi:hypothetical protein
MSTNNEVATCQANVKSKTDPDDIDVCGKPATEAVVEHGDYVPVCSHHAMIARRNHWAVGRLKPHQTSADREGERG